MKLFLKNGIAFFRDLGYIPGTDLKIELDIPGVDHEIHQISVKVNNYPSRSCIHSFVINEQQLVDMKTLKVDVTVTHKETGIKQVFPMDEIPLKKAFIIGGNTEELYPVVLRELRNEVKKLKEDLQLTNRALVEVGRRGEII